MGAFQAVASGLGETGENAGQGINNALNEALKVRAQLHGEEMDTAHLGLAQATLKQQYDLAQQQHELMRQQMLESGWTHTGTARDPDGSYYQLFDNPRMPPGQQTRRIPYGGVGVPPDSFEAHMANRQQLIEQGYDKDKAAEIAFKVSGLYRTDPAGLVKEYQSLAKEMNEEKGIAKVPVFGFGTIPIDSPEGQAKYAQAMVDSGRGMAPLLRAMMGYGPGKQVDMTGWTANEQREYKALESEVLRKEQAYEKMASATIGSTISTDPAATMKQATSMFDNLVDPLHAQLQAKQDEINGRHGRTGPGAAPKKGAYKIGNIWYDATTHLPIPGQAGQ